ncbi:DUF357 domain-containing protein [Candidatus Woesearchaeota archaeon]|nr:MAG: DUF357 domain-containing protein [Candidatus Woesearchaeota archaeon]
MRKGEERLAGRLLSEELLSRYVSITKEALAVARRAPKGAGADVVLDMAKRYVADAEFFSKKGKKLLAFAAVNYAHGWLDAGARLGCFVVKDNHLFTVDDDGKE